MTAATNDEAIVFDYPVLVAENFDQILARRGQECAIGTIGSMMRELGLMLLQARGGAGKTRTAERVAEYEPESNGVAFVSALKLPVDQVGAVRSLGLDMLVELSADTRRAGLLRDRAEGLVVIDGINEIPRKRADEILGALPALAARYPFIRFLVTDRLTRRDVEQSAWLLSTLGPIPESQARILSGSADCEPLPEHLTVPYYLNQMIRVNGAGSQVEILRDGIVVHGGASPEELPALARAIYDSYKERSDRWISRQTLIGAVGRETFDRMRESGLLREQRDGGAQFEHHLNQDFLAALHVSHDADLWSPPGFDALTLKASSFDALALAAALVHPESHVDNFVHCVFDWNYYGAAYLLEDDQNGSKRIWDAMRTAILATLAEKRFDIMVATTRRVEDALRLQDSEFTKDLLLAADREKVVEIIARSLPQDWEDRWPAWFREWYVIFSRSSRDKATLDDVKKLESNIGMIGWAASNMLKRLDIGKKLRANVRDFASDSQDATIRWRSVHVLGALPTRGVVDLLLARVGDDREALWVRYGAIRSVLETAASGPERIRRRVFSALGDPVLARQINAEPHLRREAIRSLEVAEMPADWHSLAGDFLEYLWTHAGDPLSRDEVVLLAGRLRRASTVAV